MTIHWKTDEQFFTVMCLTIPWKAVELYYLTQFVILENLSILELARSGVNGLIELEGSTLQRSCPSGGSRFGLY